MHPDLRTNAREADIIGGATRADDRRAVKAPALTG